MALLLQKLILSALSSLTSLATLVIFRIVALLIVLLIQVVRVPSVLIEGALQLIASLLKVILESVLELIKDGFVSAVSNGIELVSSTATGSISLTTSAVMELAEKMKNALDGLAEIFPEAFERVSEMIGKMGLDLCDNYRDAVGCFIKNV